GLVIGGSYEQPPEFRGEGVETRPHLCHGEMLHRAGRWHPMTSIPCSRRPQDGSALRGLLHVAINRSDDALVDSFARLSFAQLREIIRMSLEAIEHSAVHQTPELPVFRTPV